jgi:uncharacterized membrane protein
MTPTNPTHAPHDAKMRQVELFISHLLKVGVLTSLAVVILGSVISFVRHPEYLTQPPALRRLTHPGAAFPHTVGEMWAGLKDGRGQAIVVLGLLLLIATPVLRVAASIFGFLYEGDRVYVAITTLVLALLVLSFVIGKVE